MKLVAIYARHSSDLSDERSSEDRVAYCKEFAARMPGWEVAKVYMDAAISGSAFRGRPQAEAMLHDAMAGVFDIILAEHPDRISRRTADLAGLFDELHFRNIELWGVNTGKLDALTAGMHGMMAQQQREETGRKVKRGMKPKAAAGRFMGGKPYGYRLRITRTHDVRDKGAPDIHEEEARRVVRIFEEYVAGRSAVDIAHGLNLDNIPAPRGGRWNASTIHGMKGRGSGILNNSIYVGRPAWNKVTMKKVPGEARKRISRPNDRSAYVVTSSPDLRIIPDSLFNAAQSRKEARAILHPSGRQKQKRLLSGLLRCPGCGSGMSIKGKDKVGIRIRCTRDAESKTCPDPQSFYLEVIERKVIEAIISFFSSPEDISAVLKAARAEARKAADNRAGERSALERQIAELDRTIDRVTHMLIEGLGDEKKNDQVVKQAAAKKAELEAKLAATLKEQPVSNLIDLHPAAVKRILATATELRAMMERGDLCGDHDLSEALRFFIHEIVIHPGVCYRAEPTVEVRSPWVAFDPAPSGGSLRSVLSGG